MKITKQEKILDNNPSLIYTAYYPGYLNPHVFSDTGESLFSAHFFIFPNSFILALCI